MEPEEQGSILGGKPHDEPPSTRCGKGRRIQPGIFPGFVVSFRTRGCYLHGNTNVEHRGDGTIGLCVRMCPHAGPGTGRELAETGVAAMLTLSSPDGVRLCDGLTRREVLRVG